MPKTKSAKDALEQLIQQFAQPMSFLRELVQNSLDAGTTQVEINVGFDRPSRKCFVQVKDNGEGMDEEIIDNRLTRLFSSTKEDDLTKIGKFGIGFVSIFAVAPELVVMETGKEGEYWRILFKPDRSFEKRELLEPTEGTSITLYLPRPQSKLRDLIKEAEKTIVYWCKYSATEILFNGEKINQSFGFEDEKYVFRFKRDNTEAALSPSHESNGFQGFYNRGLTLLEGPGSPIPYLKFRVRSPYLEHTLSRDNIIRDDNYHRIIKQIQVAASKEMPNDLFSKLEEEFSEGYWRAALKIIRLEGAIESARSRKIIPVGEGKLSLKELPSTVAYHHERNELTRAVEAFGQPVVHCQRGSAMLEFLIQANILPVALEKRFILYRRTEPDKDEQLVLELLAAHARHLSDTFVAELLTKAPRSRDMKPMALFLNPTQQARPVDQDGRTRKDSIGLLRGHPLLKKVARLSKRHPELAVGLLVRKLNLDLQLGFKGESKLLSASLQRIRSRIKPS